MTAPSSAALSDLTWFNEFLWHEGTDQRYGARDLKRAIEQWVVFPMANLSATGQVKARRHALH